MAPRNFRIARQPSSVAPTPVAHIAEHDSRRALRPSQTHFQPDIAALTNLQRALENFGVVDVNAFSDHLAARNQAPQLIQGTYRAVLTAVATPVRILFKNPRRQSWLISNFTDTAEILFSYDFPNQFAANILEGVNVPPTGFFQEPNGSVSINDIWVWTNDGNAQFPFPVIAYEGQLSIAGNKQ